MKTFEIDFVRRPLSPWIGFAFFCASAIALLWSWNQFVDERDSARAAVTEQRRALEAASLPRAPSAEDLKRSQERAQERAALAYSWKNVFDALEAAGGADVKVVSFSHERGSGKSHVVLEGQNYGAIDTAVTRMKQASPANVVWRIDSLSQDRAGAVNVVRADVSSTW